MVWCLIDLKWEAGDFGYAVLSNGSTEVEIMFYAELHDQAVVLQRLDIQGAGPNVLGWTALRELAHQAMEELDVDELRIEGAVRTSGAGPGRRPTPLIFRRTGRLGA
jgi:hypothetical protein